MLSIVGQQGAPVLHGDEELLVVRKPPAARSDRAGRIEPPGAKVFCEERIHVLVEVEPDQAHPSAILEGARKGCSTSKASFSRL